MSDIQSAFFAAASLGADCNGGHGTTASSTIVYEIEPGKRLGWHTDATEETQYIIAGTGELHMEDGSKHPVGPGTVFVLPTPVEHDLVNVGNETLRAVAFFAAAMFTQNFRAAKPRPEAYDDAYEFIFEEEEGGPCNFEGNRFVKVYTKATNDPKGTSKRQWRVLVKADWDIAQAKFTSQKVTPVRE